MYCMVGRRCWGGIRQGAACGSGTGCLVRRSGSLIGVSFRPETLRPGQSAQAPGRVEYRLARNAVVRDLRRGRLSRSDVCDAHPELLRAAHNLGQPSLEVCPVCEEANVVLVSFAFGPRLPPGGRCLASRQDLDKLAGRSSQVACYVVEVCPECSWNHLATMSIVGGRS